MAGADEGELAVPDRRELDKVMEKPLSNAVLRAAKKQIRGQIGIACDSRESFALDFAKTYLHYGWLKDVTALCERIDTLTAEEIQAVARETFSEENLTRMKHVLPNFGVGYRWEFKKNVNVRLDYGFGKHGQKGFIFKDNIIKL